MLCIYGLITVGSGWELATRSPAAALQARRHVVRSRLMRTSGRFLERVYSWIPVSVWYRSGRLSKLRDGASATRLARPAAVVSLADAKDASTLRKLPSPMLQEPLAVSFTEVLPPAPYKVPPTCEPMPRLKGGQSYTPAISRKRTSMAVYERSALANEVPAVPASRWSADARRARVDFTEGCTPANFPALARAVAGRSPARGYGSRAARPSNAGSARGCPLGPLRERL